MIKYIKSELFRTFKTPMYKQFLGISVLIVFLSVLTWGTIINVGEDYLQLMTIFSTFAILIISTISMTITFKTKDTKVQILSYGIKRSEMYFADLVTLQIISIITTVLLGILAIGSAALGEMLGLVVVEMPYSAFINHVVRLILFFININNGIFGLSYILNNLSLGVIGTFLLIPMISSLMLAFTSGKPIGNLINNFYKIQPYPLFENYVGITEFNQDVIKTIVFSVLFTIIVYVLGGFVGFRKREIY